MWLAADIGEGSIFTKADLRAAFPNVEQVDRRMRDLRQEGWVIWTSREDAQLAVDELRLVTVGGAVWEPGYVSVASANTEKTRREVLAADNFRCVFCGVGAGEPYPDDQLRVARLRVTGSQSPRTACDRCKPSDRQRSDELSKVIRALSAGEREQLSTWLARGTREWSDLDRAWALCWRLSADERSSLAKELRP